MLIVPTNPGQLLNHIKNNLLGNVNPKENNLHLNKIAITNDEELVGTCQKSDDNEKIVSMVHDKLSDSYVVKEMR